MSSTLAKPRISEDQYLALEAASEARHEWYDGELFAMAGSSDRHGVLCYNFAGELRARMRGGPCVAFITDHRHHVPAAGSYTYPDLVIRCRPAPEAAPEVRVLVEVLSESTEAFDRGDKFARYRADPALQEYVLVSQRARRVEHFRRLDTGRWELTIYGPGDDVVLPALGVVVPMAEIYLGAEQERSDDAGDPYRLE